MLQHVKVVNSTNSLSDDDSEIRHGFCANTPLPQSS